ncbi:hypothetical protein EDB85DRAFT_1948865 [Lactarius pseudohatsudake]|nr:hypothetical protein EDB85DRAFT_1948865 [Lactarius pseudohatsudake]
MDHPHRLQPIDPHSDRPSGVKPSSSTKSLRKERSWLSELGFEPGSYASPASPPTTQSNAYQGEMPGRAWPNSIGSSLQSFYTAHSSLSHSSPLQTMFTNSTASSNPSFPYSVTSVNSYKSRKNVLYPRRAHPPPVVVSPEYIVSPNVLIWEVRFLCANLLPQAETRLVPAATVLLRSLGLQGDFSQASPNMQIDGLRCSEFFIVLTHEVFLRGAAGAKELEGPCEFLHETFRDILFKSGAFTPRSSSNSNAMVLRASLVEAQDSERFTRVLRALCSVMDTFEGALNVVKPPAASDEVLRESHRQVLLKFSIFKGITMGQYRKELGQKLFQTQTAIERLHPLSTSGTPMIRPYHVASQAIATIEEGLEAGDERSFVNRHSPSRSESGAHTFPRRFLSRFLSHFKG